MATLEQTRSVTITPSAGIQSARAGVIPLFSTWIYESREGPEHLNQDLEQLVRVLMQDERNGARRTNCGGWHYAFDLFKRTEPVVLELRSILEQHAQGFLNHFRLEQRKRQDRFRIEGWINVNRAGDRNLLHCHPGSFLSGVYYVKVPHGMSGGQVLFRDPRGPAVAMYEAPQIELPWVGTGVGIPFSPVTGLLLLFPAWLEHRVEPFAGDGERISVAFNLSNP